MATNDGGRPPRAVIHKRILDSAESDPDASLDALADEVAGASPDLVERVLDEYGDPGGTEPIPTQPEESTMPDPAPTTTATELTEKQRATLEAIADRPEATQAELADALGVSRATVNKRLNAIEGFEWTDRERFVEGVLDADIAAATSGDASDAEPDPDEPDPAPSAEPATEPAAEASDSDPESSADGTDAEPASTAERATGPAAEAAVDGGQLLDPDAAAAVEQLQERVARLEQQLGGGGPAIEDTELLAKVFRAVLADDEISQAEEVVVLEALR